MWGIVFSYVEGGRTTDFIGAVMAVSFIFAGGFTRSGALWLKVSWGVPEQWLAFVTGLIFVIPLVFFMYLLERIPPPDADDIEERTVRPANDKGAKGENFFSFIWCWYYCYHYYLSVPYRYA